MFSFIFFFLLILSNQMYVLLSDVYEQAATLRKI